MQLKLFLAFLICFNYSQAQTTDTTLLIGKIEKANLKKYSWYEMIYFTIDRESYCIGQLALFRRLLGYEAMKYS